MFIWIFISAHSIIIFLSQAYLSAKILVLSYHLILFEISAGVHSIILSFNLSTHGRCLMPIIWFIALNTINNK